MPHGQPSLIFMKLRPSEGVVLASMAVLALILANTRFAPLYFKLINTSLWPSGFSLSAACRDGLMSLFFLYIGLEFNYELKSGRLSDLKTLKLPMACALGGMVVPALIYCLINWGHGLKGFGVPMATDIAFSLALYAAVGKHLSPDLRVFLLSLAIVDDILSLIILGLFYGQPMSVLTLWPILLMCMALWLLRYVSHRLYDVAFLLVSLIGFALSLKLGLSLSLSALIFAAFVPPAAAKRLIKTLHGLVHGLILPLFAFVSVGISFTALGLTSLISAPCLGVALGLSLGKFIGIAGVSYGLIRLGFTTLPQGVSPSHLNYTALLCGIGFTMSLYMAELASSSPIEQGQLKLGILLGSCLSALIGGIGLARSAKQPSVNHQ